MNKILFIYLASVLSLISCRNDHNTVELKTIDVTENNLNPVVEDLIDIKSIIALETNKECLIGRIHKIEVFNEKIYILDYHNKTLFVFNLLDGHFLFKIRSLGKGPGEYIALYDFIIDEYESNIKILDRGKILTFNLQGEFISEKRLKFSPTKFERLDRNTYCFWSGSNSVRETNYYTLHYTNNNYSVKESFLRDTTNRIFDSPKMFYKCENKILLRPSYYSNLISQLNEEPELMYEINFDGKWINNIVNKDQVNQQIRSGAYYKIKNFYDFNDIIYFNVVRKGKLYRIVHYCNSQKTIGWSRASENSVFCLNPLNVDEFYAGFVYWHIEPASLKKQISNLEYRGVHKVLIDKFDLKNKLSSNNIANSNPFIVKYVFKNIK